MRVVSGKDSVRVEPDGIVPGMWIEMNREKLGGTPLCQLHDSRQAPQSLHPSISRL